MPKVPLGQKSPSGEPLIYQDLNNLTAASISDLIRLPQLPLLYSLKTQGHSHPKACCSLSLGISTQMSPPALGFPRPPNGQEPPTPITFYHITLFSFLHGAHPCPSLHHYLQSTRKNLRPEAMRPGYVAPAGRPPAPHPGQEGSSSQRLPPALPKKTEAEVGEGPG